MIKKTNDNSLIFLTVSYIWLLLFAISVFIIEPSAKPRAFFMFVAIAPVLITHIIISFNIKAWHSNKHFFVLSMLWIINFMLFVITEGIYLGTQQTMLKLDLVDLFFKFIIFILIFSSFLLHRPFFYTKTEKKIIVLIGILGIAVTLWISYQLALSLIDFYS